MDIERLIGSVFYENEWNELCHYISPNDFGKSISRLVSKEKFKSKRKYENSQENSEQMLRLLRTVVLINNTTHLPQNIIKSIKDQFLLFFNSGVKVSFDQFKNFTYHLEEDDSKLQKLYSELIEENNKVQKLTGQQLFISWKGETA